MKITACYIVRNESADLRRSITSLHHAYDELLVVDTGSTDDTCAVATQLGAKLLHFTWCDDFSAVRNFAIEHATGDVLVFLDADEYLADGKGENLRNVIHHMEDMDALLVRRYDINGAENQILGDVYVLRIFRRTARLRYAGRIHEELRDEGKDISRMAIVPEQELCLYHTGYEQGRGKEKAERNLRILQEELQTTTYPGRLYMYLAEAYHGLGDEAHTEEYARKDIAQGRRSVVYASRSWHLLLELLAKDPARKEERAAFARQSVQDFPELPEFHAEYAAVLAQALDFRGAAQEMEQAIACAARQEEQPGLEPRQFDAAMVQQAKELLRTWQGITAQAEGLSLTSCLLTASGDRAMLTDWLRRAGVYSTAILIGDTGTPEGVLLQAVEEAGVAGRVRVIDVPWQGDFAAARNRLLDAVPRDADWLVFLDDDETFVEPAHVRPALAAARRRQPGTLGILVNIVNVDADAADLEISRFPALRIWRHSAERRYVGRVHEALYEAGQPLSGQVYEPRLLVRHTGYSSHRMHAKLERNLQLLYADIQERGEQPLHYRYLADCLYGLREYELAIHYARLAIERGPRTTAGDGDMYADWLNSVEALHRPLAERIAVAERAVSALPDQAEFHGKLGILLARQGKRARAEQELAAYTKLLARAEQNSSAAFAIRAAVMRTESQLHAESLPEVAREELRSSLAIDPWQEESLQALWQQTGVAGTSSDAAPDGTAGAHAFLDTVLPFYADRAQGLHFVLVWAERQEHEALYAAAERALQAAGQTDACAPLHAMLAAGNADGLRQAVFGQAVTYVQELFAAMCELAAAEAASTTDGQGAARVPRDRLTEWEALLPVPFQQLVHAMQQAGAEGETGMKLPSWGDYQAGRQAIEGFVSDRAMACYDALAARYPEGQQGGEHDEQ